MLPDLIAKGKYLVDHPDPKSNHEPVLKIFKNAITTLEQRSHDTLSDMSEKIAEIYGIMNSINQQFLPPYDPTELSYSWASLAIRLASYMDFEIKEDLLKQVDNFSFLLGGAYWRNESVTLFHSIINDYRALTKAMSKKSFQEKQSQSVKSIVERILDTIKRHYKQADYGSFFMNVSIRCLSETELLLFLDIAEDYLLTSINNEVSDRDHYHVFIKLLQASRENKTNKSDYNSRIVSMYMRAGKRSEEFPKGLLFFFIQAGLSFTPQAAYNTVTAANLQSLLEQLQALPENPHLPSKEKDWSPPYSIIYSISEKLSQYKNQFINLWKLTKTFFAKKQGKYYLSYIQSFLRW